MAVNYAASLKTTRMQAVIAAIDANATPAYVEVASAGFGAVLVTFVLGDPSFSESGGIITMLGVPIFAMAAASGTAAVARIKDGGGNVIVNNLSVGVSGADINLISTQIDAGQQMAITSGKITHAP